MVLLWYATTILFVFFVLYFFIGERRFFAHRSRIIDLPINVVSPFLDDLANWPEWIPWLIYDPNADIAYEYTNIGARAVLPSGMQWRGKRIKEGFIELKATRSGYHDYHAWIEAPAFFPNDIELKIHLEKQGSHTLISTQMFGVVPFLRRWMSTKYLVRADKDLELALIRLNAALSKHHPFSESEYDNLTFEWLSSTKLEHLDAVVRPFAVSDEPMSQKMEQGFHNLLVALGPDNPPAGPSFALYTKADPAHHHFSGQLGIPIQNLVPCSLHPERIVLEGEYLQIRYTGNYQHLHLAWHVLYTYMRLQHLRPNRKRPGIEIFESGPSHVDSAHNYVTRIGLPIKQ